MQRQASCSNASGLFIGLCLYCIQWQTRGHTAVDRWQTRRARVALLGFGAALALLVTAASGQTLQVVPPPGNDPLAAIAEAAAGSAQTRGTFRDGTLHFDNLLPDTPYHVRIELRDGRVLQGVDLGWYAAVNDPTPPGNLDAEGRAEIAAIVTKVPQFYNRSELLRLEGNARRATALVQLVRDAAFHGDRGGEVIWRVELWYFEYQAGGWARVSQQNVVLRRERFRDRAAYENATAKLKWIPRLGGLRVGRGETKRIDLSGE